MAKSLHDLPQFTVSSVRTGQTAADGRTDYQLAGTFNTLDGVKLGHRCWLIRPDLHGLDSRLVELDHQSQEGMFSTSESEKPCEPAVSLAYVDGCWRADLIKMVVQPEWIWTPLSFVPSDAVEYRRKPDGTQRDENETGVLWRKISDSEILTGHPNLETSDGSRYAGDARIVPGGWDHEHCRICMKSILSGDIAFADPTNEYWFCRDCGASYLVPRDLSFVDGA